MWKKILTISILAVIMTSLASCHPERAALDDLQDFANDMKTDGSNWTDVEWYDAKIEYDELCLDLDAYVYDGYYNESEKNYINEARTECDLVFLKREADKIQKRNQGAKVEVDDNLEYE